MKRFIENTVFATFMILSIAISAVCMVSLNGCGGGGGKAAAKYDAAAVTAQQATDTTTASSTTATSTASTCDKSLGVTISWVSEVHGDGRLLDLNYHGHNLKRQVEVRGIATGQVVVVKPFGDASSSLTVATSTTATDTTALNATDTTLFATSITPYNGYTLSSVTLVGATDQYDVPYYRAWIDFAPWSESDQLPDRRVFTPIVEWNGSSYTACETAEKLEIGADYCYGLTYWNDDCLPATATTEVSPATGTTDTLYTVTCNMGTGKYYAIQIRCDITSAWQTLWEGNTLQCRYNSSGSYTPACRIDYERDDDADTAITVTETTSALPPQPATRPRALLVSARRLYRFISS